MNTELVAIPTDVVTIKGVRYAPSGTPALLSGTNTVEVLEDREGDHQPRRRLAGPRRPSPRLEEDSRVISLETQERRKP